MNSELFLPRCISRVPNRPRIMATSPAASQVKFGVICTCCTRQMILNDLIGRPFEKAEPSGVQSVTEFLNGQPFFQKVRDGCRTIRGPAAPWRSKQRCGTHWLSTPPRTSVPFLSLALLALEADGIDANLSESSQPSRRAC
jgi:hypothetical protein